jgi:ribosomal protein S1
MSDPYHEPNERAPEERVAPHPDIDETAASPDDHHVDGESPPGAVEPTPAVSPEPVRKPRDKPRAGDLDAHLDAEIEAALGEMSIDDMLDEGPSTHARPSGRGAPASRPQREDRRPGERASRGIGPDRRTGTVVQLHGEQVMVEFGPKAQGMCPLSQFPEPPALGSRIEFTVVRRDPDDGLLILARAGTAHKAEWETLEVGQVVEARCIGVNKGGLEMEVANHRAFMPGGHVDLRHIADLSVYVGEKMPCEVIEVDRRPGGRGRIILSRRSALQQERAQRRKDLLQSLEVGQTLPAVITSVQPYGAFADLGGIDGLIHISDLSFERIKHPSEVVKEGDKVQVKVLKIEGEQDPPRIGLGLKQTMADPYAANLSAIAEGEVVTGKVTKLMAFGAFVELGQGLEGLIHISELSHERVHKVSQVVKPGQVVTVKVLSIDPERRRVALSLKQTLEHRERQIDRGEDKRMKKLRAQLVKKFGELKGGIG